MRTRLLALLLALMAVVVIVPGFVLARSLAAGELQAVFLDRLNDTTRFASIAQQDFASAELLTLQAEMDQYDGVYGVTAAILARDGMVRIASRARLEIGSVSAKERIAAGLSGRRSETAPTRWPWDSEPLVVASPVVVGGDVVGVAVTVSPTDSLNRSVLRRWALLAVSMLAALGCCVLLALRVTRWVLRPVNTLDTATHVIATGQLSARVPSTSGPPELRRLATSFNEMADAVESAVKRQRAFVADASHQLRNPLSALMLRLEHLAMGLADERSEELELTREEGRRLTQVLDELLTLARSEDGVAAFEVVDVTRIAHDRLEVWRVVADRRGIDLRLQGASHAPACTDRVALGGALDTVIDNALKFSPEGSRVVVEVTGADGVVVLRVVDEGGGLSDEELERIGDRFWRSARHQNIAGSGLGLAIARALVTRCGGELAVARELSSTGAGLAVTLTVPSVTA